MNKEITISILKPINPGLTKEEFINTLEKKIYSDQPEYAFLLAWHISNEIITNLRKKGFKGKFIVPLPNLKIS